MTTPRLPWSGYGLTAGDVGSGYGKKGTAAAPAGASLWTLVAADGGVGTAPASDLNDWTCYVSAGMGSRDYNSIAFGKDGADGDPLWVAVNQNNNKDIRFSSDPAAGVGAWSNANPAAEMVGVGWGDGVWLACGGSGKVYKATTMANGWAEIDLTGVTGWASDVTIYEVVSDGAGEWMFAQGMNVFHSTDDGDTWVRVIDFSTVVDPSLNPPANFSGYKAYTMAYTANRWSMFMRKTSNSRVFTAAAGATGTWVAATAGGQPQTAQNIVGSAARRMSAGAGTAILVGQGNATSRSTDGGQDWTKYTGNYPGTGLLPRTDARDIATDGAENWVCVHDSGRVSLSDDDGLIWVEQTGNQGGGNTNMRFPTGGNNVENLDSVAADVLLPK